MRQRCVIFCLSFLLLTVTSLEAAPLVEMELITGGNFAAREAHDWIKTLAELGIRDVRIRGAQGREKPEIRNVGSEDRPRYKVVGILERGGQMYLPGGKFSQRDAAKLKTYIQNLQADGIEGVTAPRSAFGLTPSQLSELNEALSAPITVKTKGAELGEIVQNIVSRLTIDVYLPRSSMAALDEADPFGDEMQGLSAGTALAAVLRPAGLIAVPSRPAGGETRLAIVPAKEGTAGWPIGWPPERKDRELMPILYEFLEVEIENIPLSETIDAIGGRLEVPILLDRNKIVLHRIDMQTKVSFPPGRSYYKRILDRALFQGKLKAEVRIDEAGNPLLWITTIKR